MGVGTGKGLCSTPLCESCTAAAIHAVSKIKIPFILIMLIWQNLHKIGLKVVAVTSIGKIHTT